MTKDNWIKKVCKNCGDKYPNKNIYIDEEGRCISCGKQCGLTKKQMESVGMISESWEVVFEKKASEEGKDGFLRRGDFGQLEYDLEKVKGFIKSVRDEAYSAGREKGNYLISEIRSKCCGDGVYIQCYEPEPGYHCKKCDEQCNNPEGIYYE